MEEPAAEARRKRLQALDYPSFWDSVEVQEELLTAATRNSEAPDGPDVADSEVNGPSEVVINNHRPTVLEYYATDFFKIAAHFSGIAAAQSGKPKRQIDEDRHILEQPIARSSNK